MSGAERELRALLDVIAKSLLLSTVVCVGGVELPSTEQQEELPLRRIFGCGSPNLPGKSAAFVGQYATAFADLQMDKARLTMDDIDILGMRFIFRQNAVRNYVYHPPTSAGSVEEHQSSFRGHMEVRTSLNLSCSGFLYNIMVFVDVVLLMMHAWSAFELLERLILSSLLRTPTKHDMRDLSKGEGRWSLFACSLVHSPPVAILMMISALLSWLLLLPHTAVWALSSDESSYSAAAVHTLLSALRVWVLLLLLVKALWSIFVFFDEGRAYMLATRTYVSSAEIVMAVATAGVLLRRRLLSVLPSKHEMDHQQVVDGAAFPGRLAISNAFEDVARSLSIRTQHPVLWLIYSPLIELLLLSSVIVGLGMTARYLLQSHRLHVAENAVTTVEDVDGILDDTFPTTSRPSTAGFSTAQAVIAGYKRLPLEELLDVPIRAKHIVRSSGDGGLEKTVDNDQFLWTVQYLSHGVLLENDRFLSTRRGFFRVLPMIEPVDASGRPSASGVCGKETSGSPKRRRYTTTFSFT
ncbi:hypothetical protein PHYBOEH_008867 [Phytophthora boehmeriae]|uniref:Transmembrane protein n=1 Tax=Phytophthora boehmeriae TaxID=109152 RepID=A0A8T1VWU4_9STRA|nr:hypothetical protein PHYBOEH_008867 [Phytophthora boehmeriae]